MTVVAKGAVNTTAQITPGLLVQIVPPSVSQLNGVATNKLGIVGTASWGPVNSPVPFSTMADYARNFGAIQARKYDLGTQAAVAVQQGANNLLGVRVTDGTDTAASVAVQTNCVTLTAKYTGTLGNSIQVTLANGSQASTYKATVSLPGRLPEVFDNIGGTGAQFWANLASAINNGQSGLRGPSDVITATVGAGTAAPTLATLTLTGGTDGATTINGAVLVGVDTIPRKGMYALRNTGVSIAFLADCDDSTTYASQVAFGLGEGVYMQIVGVAGDTIANAISAKSTAAIDTYTAKVLFGDWIYWNDTVNGQIRLVSPQGFAAGRLANLSPEQSSLNKPLQGIVATQKSSLNQVYSDAELAQLAAAGIDVITNPSPGGNFFSLRIGHNASSDPTINGDNYVRMTNYIAYSLNAGLGKFIGRLNNADERREARSSLISFFANMQGQGMITDFSVVLDDSNNPQARVAQSYQQADVKVQYLAIVEHMLVNIEGGQTVTISRQSTAPAV